MPEFLDFRQRYCVAFSERPDAGPAEIGDMAEATEPLAHVARQAANIGALAAGKFEFGGGVIRTAKQVEGMDGHLPGRDLHILAGGGRGRRRAARRS